MNCHVPDWRSNIKEKSKMKRLVLIGAVVVCWTLSSFAATDYSVRDAHLNSDVGSGSAFDSSHGNYWSPNGVPTDDKTYYIPGNRTATVGGTCHGKWVYNGGTLYASGSEAVWTELRMGPGATYRWWSQVGIAGRIVIEGTGNKPSLFSKGPKLLLGLVIQSPASNLISSVSSLNSPDMAYSPI